ncbi:MAG: hypothetical protein HY236_04495 [Acidobacteria bacterium]|nr:hypothetical protein [Acidobacteriota bacterium]
MVLTRNASAATVLFLASVLAAAQPEPRSWLPEPRPLSAAVADADPQTYEVLCAGPHNDPCDAGLEWKEPQTFGELQIDYATLFGRAYQPAFAGQALQFWAGTAWQDLPAVIEIDYRKQAEFAPLQGSGAVRWTYRFAPVSTTRLRVLLSQPENADPGHRVYAVREIQAAQGTGAAVTPGIRVLGALASIPAWLEPGGNMAVPEAGARIVPGRAAEIRWPRRMLVNHVKAEAAADPLRVEWWDGAGWRAVEPLPFPGAGEARFQPISTERLRVTGNQPIRKLEARLDAEAERYFREVEQSRVDLLGARFRGQTRRDLAAMQSLLLPLDFAKTAIGRPADREETIVLSNGTFLMVEETADEKAAKRDRWFAPAAGVGKQLFGAQWTHAASHYLDGYLPGTVTTYSDGAFDFEERLYVTAPDDELYGTVAEVTVTNRSEAAGRTAFTLAMGRRRSQRSPGEKTSVFFFDPQPTGYTLDPDKHTVRSAAGEVILYSEAAGVWEGTPRENHLRYPLSLAPKRTETLRFFIPSVERPLRAADALRHLDWQASFERFRSWWNRKLEAGMKIEVPEPPLNNIYKNLLAQSLIITLDGDSLVRYGAYFYEMYFGIEEGWPAVALAQYGYPAEAQKILSIMLSPELMDKSNYHHQYRNGLEPWYAATIYRLTKDRAWLEKIAPELAAAAAWTLRVTNEDRDRKYPGILPRHAYGGDIRTPAYSFYSNATCWRGLNDTALMFRVLEQHRQARQYQEEADSYRRRLWQLADKLADRDSKPPFLPMSFEIGSGGEYREKEPAYSFLGINTPVSNTWTYLGNYWNLMAPMLGEVKLFENDDPRAAWVPDYMEARGGVLAGLARFTLGLDQIYGKGYYESLLEQGRRDRFWTSLYGIFAHGMSHNLYSFPEVAGVFPLRVSNAAMWREHQRNLWNWYFQWSWGFEGWQSTEGEPLSAGPGMALEMLRMALVRETIETSPQDTLRLLDGAPPHWFEPGKRIVVRDALTFFGKVSLETEASAGGVRATVTRSPGFSARQVILRLAHPSGRPLGEVTIDGRPWSDFSGEEIPLPSGDRLEIAASFRP